MSFTESLDSLVESNPNGLLGAHPSWGRVPLREVCSILNGFPFESKLFSQAGGMPLIRIRDVGRDRTDTCFTGSYDSAYLVQKGDLLVGMDGDFRCDVWKGGAALLNQRVCKLVVDSGRYSPRFLRYVLQGYLDAIHTKTSSVTVKHLSSRTIGEIPLPLPSRSEQDAISDTLDELLSDLQAGVECLVQAQTKLKAYRASVLKAAVEGRLVPTEAELAKAEGRTYEAADKLLERILRERRKKAEPAPPNLAGAPELPEGWSWASIGQVAMSVDQGWSPLCEKRPSASAAEWSVIRTTAIQAGEFRAGENKALSAGLEPRPNLQLTMGDVLITRAGPRSRVGVCCLVRTTPARTMLCDKVYRLRVAKPVVPEFVELALNSPHAVSQFEERKTGISDSGVNLTQQRFLEMWLPLPPTTEQVRIVEEVERQLTTVMQTSTLIEHQATRCSRLRQAILKAAFEGRLVDQDPNDEPASELLARLRATPEPAPKPKRGRAPKKTS